MFKIEFNKYATEMTEITITKNKKCLKESLQEKFKKYSTHYDVLTLAFFTSIGTLQTCYIEDEEDLERILNLVDNIEVNTTGDDEKDRERLLHYYYYALKSACPTHTDNVKLQ